MIKTNVNELVQVLKKAMPAVGKDGSGVMNIQANGKRLMVQTSDGFCAISSVIPCDCEEKVSFYVECAAFYAVMQEIQKLGLEDGTVSLEIGNILTVTGGRTRVDLPFCLESEYKMITPAASTEVPVEVTMDGHWFRKAVNSSVRRTDPEASGMKGNIYIRLKKDCFEAGGTQGTHMSIVEHAVYTDTSRFHLEEDYLDIALTSARASAIVRVLDDSDVGMKVYDKYIVLTNAASVFVVPKATNDTKWSFRNTIDRFMEMASNGATVDVDRKALIQALSLISCNLSKSKESTNSWVVSIAMNKDYLTLSNAAGTATTEVQANSMEGSIEGKMAFSIEMLKNLLNSLENESVLMTLAKQEHGTHTVHFEENTEQVVLLGVSMRKGE